MSTTAIRTVLAGRASMQAAWLAAGSASREKAHVMTIQKEEEKHCAQHTGNIHVRARNGTIATLPDATAMTVPRVTFSNASTAVALSGHFHQAAIIGTIAPFVSTHDTSM